MGKSCRYRKMVHLTEVAEMIEHCLAVEADDKADQVAHGMTLGDEVETKGAY